MPDQEHKQYIDGKICEIKECPECDGSGIILTPTEPDGENDEDRCARCQGLGYIKK